MDRTPNSLRKTRSPREKEPEQNINCDFCRNIFNMLASSYGMPTDPQIPLHFKKDKKTVSEEKSPAFQSKIVDLRLRRQQEQRSQIQDDSNVRISSLIEEVSQKLKDNLEDIDDVFQPEKANRSDVPLYLRNTEYDHRAEERYERARRSPHQPMNMKSITKEYTNRLERSQIIGTARAEKRVLRMQMHALENNVPNQHIIGHDDSDYDY
ncbi:hypothetical protein TRFO_09839 [Tritrichomonas foetus]|uniref:Uncharacterized protein n=1 Tax=Tritrichomonas foetus TaxID=1144522 RepID=A0A1J4JEG1_9EUKA|nr:hypothetical protein TRFO_09839 [Tritrichomonas foetus]|eukprot:OHS96679.1 hypothetical protein TRFO_09839 [Tritrichomonas foetus]